jgi:hypothetical protein
MRLFIILFFVTTNLVAQKENPTETTDRRDKLDTILLRPRITNADTLMAFVRRGYEVNHNTARLFMNFKHEKTTIVQPQILKIDLERTPSSKTKKNQVNDQLLALANELKKKPAKDYRQYTGVYNGQARAGLYMNLQSAYSFKNYAQYTAIEELLPKLEKALGDELSKTERYKVRSGILPVDTNIMLVLDTAATRTYTDKKGKEQTYTRDKRASVLSGVNNMVQGGKDEFGSRLDLLNTDFYNYEILDFIQTDSLNYYNVAFEPAGRKNKFAGTIRINAADFGILHLKYGFAENRHGHKVNLKLLLGVKFSNPVHDVEITFAKHESGVYYPISILEHTWSQMYAHRPFQFKNLSNNGRYRFDFKCDAFVLTYETLTIAQVVEKEQPQKQRYTGVKKYTILDAPK